MQFTVERTHFTSIFPAASLIFSTFASDRPLMLHKALRVVIWIPFTVQMPTDFNFLMSAIFCGQRKGGGVQRDRQLTLYLMTLQVKHCMVVLIIVKIQGALCQGTAFLSCPVYSQSRVFVGGQCLGRRTPVRIREKEILHLVVPEE